MTQFSEHVGRSACYRFITCVIIIEKLHLYRSNPLLCFIGDNSLQTCSMSGNFSQKVSVADVSHKSTFPRHWLTGCIATDSLLMHTTSVCFTNDGWGSMYFWVCHTVWKCWGKKDNICCILFVFAWMCLYF